MSETKFTKGKWRWEHDESTASMIQVSCDSGSDVCRLQSENDANLIAAAPEMYEMLKYNRQAWVNLLDLNLINQSHEKDVYKIIDRIESLLAKARGKK